MTTSNEYSEKVQKLFLEMMIDNPESYVRVQNIYNPENFSRSLQKAASFIQEHAADHRTMPTFQQVNAVCGTELIPTDKLKEEHYDWFLDEFEKFSRSKAIFRAILTAADMLEKGNEEPIEKMIVDAVRICLVKDIGTDYFKDPRERLLAIKAGNGQSSTGWPALDRALYGGMNKGELNIFAGSSGSGKSLFMQNIAVNWFTQGLNGIYLTLELSEGLCAMRIDSMVANCSTKEIYKNIDDVELKVRIASKKSGSFQVKYLPAQSNVNDIRAYIREFQIQSGVKPEFIMIDYLDLLMPAGVKVNPSDLYVKDKYVAEELRNLAKELNILMITASQLNRCLALNTKVNVNGNVINIEDVEVGDWLESNNGPVQVSEKLPVTTQPVYKITTKSGKEIICSANHKFPVGNGLKTINSGLIVGDKLRSRTDSVAREQNDSEQKMNNS